MSHVAVQKTKKGQPLFTDKACLAKAADLKGWEIVQTNVYTWYGHHVGDYPVPEGMKVSELGRNALFVLRMKEPLRTQFKNKNGRDPYDVGVIADPDNEGCFTLIYDFWKGGYGVDETLGAPVREKGEIQLLCPELKQTYDMVCEAESAKEAGHAIRFMTLDKARQQFPHYFSAYPNRPAEDKIWISVAMTPDEQAAEEQARAFVGR